MSNKGTIEIHFAVSDLISVYSGKDSVAHVGFSVGQTSYNCGRSEGRDSSSVTSPGPFVAVRSPYRADGFYLKLTNSEKIADVFQEFVDGYLENRLDANGQSIENTGNTASSIPPGILKDMWFVKTVGGLKDIDDIKRLSNVNHATYEARIRHQFPLLADIDFEEFEEFRRASDAGGEHEVLSDAYAFFAAMKPSHYRRLRGLSGKALDDLLQLAEDIKGDLRNRMYDTFLLGSKTFDRGKYEMIQGNNCVKAAFFFLRQGMRYAEKKLRNDKASADEIERITDIIDRLEKGNKKLRIPWRSFRRARWHSDEYPGIGFLDTPEDGIFWEDVKRLKTEARLTDATKEKELTIRARRKLIDRLLKKTDVIEYEREGLEYVASNKLSPKIAARCQPYRDLLPMLNMGKGGGKRTRFSSKPIS
jgi:hypothetical protein